MIDKKVLTARTQDGGTPRRKIKSGLSSSVVKVVKVRTERSGVGTFFVTSPHFKSIRGKSIFIFALKIFNCRLKE
jgi:hypothetical protein